MDEDMETDADSTEIDAAMRAMMETLAGRGFDIPNPDWENGVLALGGVDVRRCEINAGTCGDMTWEYIPRRGAQIDPAAISRMALRLLGAHTDSPWEPHAKPNAEITPKGVVAHEMKARGLGVDVKVFVDEVGYDVDAVVEITNPAERERGAVFVSDDGAICWEFDLDELAGQAVDVADTIADALTLCG